ncbi:uncharacterized protein LOC131657547 [Vicia villosa]|uniref:uncharacterized protein LOC131657547 n=1 Tax=Vicia villosa TaxID=3911 RepID=UPI00273B5F31|nr:uncharacterized protein LOC131657547 [Vicia villosa]
MAGTGSRVKRGRGRPPKAVPPSPENHPSPSSPVKEKMTTQPVTASKMDTEKIEEEISKDETLILGMKKNVSLPESRKAEEHKLWVDILTENRNPTKGLSMQYVAPNVTNEGIVIEIEEDDIVSEVKYWETTLILYAMGEELSMNMVKNFMEKVWNFVKLPDLFYHEEGYFILRFHSHDDMDAVLMRGPYTLRNISLMLREWKPDFNLKRDMLRTVPLCVKLPKLPLHLWGEKSLSKIGSAIGVPLVTDECTTNKLRVSYARILVEVDTTREMIKEIAIKDCEGRIMKQPVEYEWKPLFCDRCQSIGHKCKDFVKRQWKPKAKPVDTEQGCSQAIATETDLKKKREADHEEQKDDIEENNWTVVGSAIKDKGKRTPTDSSTEIRCVNGFEALGILNDLIETLDGDPFKADKAKKIREKLSIHDNYLDNYLNHDNGRIWVSWSDRNLEVKMIKSSAQFIHCGVYGVMGDFRFWLTALYGMNKLEQRKNLWKDLSLLKPSSNDPWCIIGDFNNVTKAQDRIGGRMVSEAEYTDLQEMMINNGLSEMDSCGDYFTWCNRHTVDPIHSRIDRLIGNVAKDKQKGHKSRRFKFYNCLTKLPGYEETIRASWNKPIEGSPMYILWRKLQRLKPDLQQLSKNIINMKHNLEAARKDLDLAQRDLANNRMDSSRISRVKICTDEVIRLHELEEHMLIQKSKIDWLRLADDNNAFFHASIKAKHKSKSMKILKTTDGNSVTDQNSIMEEVMKFYKILMGTKEDNVKHVDIEAMRSGKQVSIGQRDALIRPVTEDEILEALKAIGDLKAPGIDGYGSYFFKSSWNIVKWDVIAAVQEFFVKGNLLKAFNSTIVTLIPKHENASEVKDFRPIAGCTTFYKIISKVLTNRLGMVLPEVIHKSQAAFLKGQVIQNHILLAFELMRGYSRKGGTPRSMIQVDLQKAYDMVDWNSLETVLNEIGLPSQFIKWIMLVTTTVSYRFNVNGEYTTIMEARRGIRQGDPISPLLFVIMMEYMNRVMIKMTRNADFKFHSKCKALKITHLTFADDVLLFSRGDKKSIEILLAAFNSFSASTGLRVNPRKCYAFYGGMGTAAKEEIGRITSYAEGQLPIRYLGIPLASKKLNVSHYLPLIDRVMSRIRHWSAHLLSTAGRIQLVKSTISATVQYWMTCLPLPDFVIRKLDSLCRSYIWSGKATISKKSPEAWKRVCCPVKQGGLNVINLSVWNHVALLKCLWNISMELDNLWVKWIHTYYLKGRDFLAENQGNNCTWILKHILASKADIGRIDNCWNSMRNQRQFSMMKIYNILIEDNVRVEWYHMMTHNFARPRAKVILWLICQNRLFTKTRMAKMGMLQNTLCDLCKEDNEDLDHLLFKCKSTFVIWQGIFKWMDMKLESNLDMAWIKRKSKGKGWPNILLKAAATVVFYGIWMYRNSMIFGSKGSYRDTHSVIRFIIDSLVYRGWMKPKYRNHLVNILM